MKLQDTIALARNALKGSKLRTNLTVAIIAIGITALIGIVTVIEVLKSTIHTSFAGMGTNTFNITSEDIKLSGKHGNRRRLRDTENKIKLTEAEEFKKRYHFPSVVSISTVASNAAIIKRGKKKSNPNTVILAADEHYIQVADITLSSGRSFTTQDVQGIQNVCIIGYAIAKKYFKYPEAATNSHLAIGDTKYRVVGVMKSKGASLIDRTDNMVIIGLNNARQKFNLSTSSYVISIRVNDIKYIHAAKDEAEGIMRQVKRLKPSDANSFAINTNDELANTLIDNLSMVTLAAALIGLITLLGAAIGLMNIMLVSVAERTREIGISKAIGAPSNVVKRQFLTESIYISIKGGLIGTLIGVLIGNILSLFFNTSFVVPWLWITIGFSLCFMVGLLAGLYPALKASRLNPIHALRYE